MNIIRRLIARSRFRKYIRKDESINVVEGMVKARQHQYCCSECHEAFKVRLSTVGAVKEIRKY